MSVFKKDVNNKKTKWDTRARIIQYFVNRKILGKSKTNLFEARNESMRVKRPNGVLVINDICYGDKYPNSYMDIMLPNDNISRKRPVVVYWHGGGFLFGSKSIGDPLAVAKVTDAGIFDKILEAGFIVVNCDYAQAPDYRFPVQLEQVNQVFETLLKAADTYGIDTERFLMMGSSAGADLTEIYGLIVSDEKYARKIGITPAVTPEQLKGLIVDESFLSLDKIEDKNMDIMTGAWLGENDVHTSDTAIIVNVPKHIKEKYIETFIVTSNKEPFFPLSANDLKEVLDKNNLLYDYFEPDVAKYGDQVPHGFLSQGDKTPVSKECFEKCIKFMKRVVDK